MLYNMLNCPRVLAAPRTEGFPRWSGSCVGVAFLILYLHLVAHRLPGTLRMSIFSAIDQACASSLRRIVLGLCSNNCRALMDTGERANALRWRNRFKRAEVLGCVLSFYFRMCLIPS